MAGGRRSWLGSRGEALQRVRSFTSCCQSLLHIRETLSPFHGGWSAGGEKSHEKLDGNIPWGLKGSFPTCVHCQPRSEAAMPCSRHARLGSSLAVPSSWLLSRLLFLFRASINNYCAVKVFPESGALLLPHLVRTSWEQSTGGPGEQFALQARVSSTREEGPVLGHQSQPALPAVLGSLVSLPGTEMMHTCRSCSNNRRQAVISLF